MGPSQHFGAGRNLWLNAPNVLVSAEQVVRHIINTYSEPNLAAEGIQFRAAKRQDALREFNNICRAALETMQNQTPIELQVRSRGPTSFFLVQFCSKLMCVSAFQHVRHSFNTREGSRAAHFKFQSFTRTPHLARAVPCLRVTGTENSNRSSEIWHAHKLFHSRPQRFVLFLSLNCDSLSPVRSRLSRHSSNVSCASLRGSETVTGANWTLKWRCVKPS